MLSTDQIKMSSGVYSINLYAESPSQTDASPREFRIMGLVLGVAKLLDVYDARGVVVPAANVYSFPPTSGVPSDAKNCSLGGKDSEVI
jgi:hypothetical protein